jgi:pyruvate/2-oxoglutarate dehydrogenase complex dihydrolipoamide acyltransferase (E2) component
VQVYFTYGDYKMIPSKNKDWSESYKYNVEVNDETHTLFAPLGLHRELQIRSIGPQCYVLITKAVELDANNKEITRWSVLNADGSERPAVEFTPDAPAAAPAPPSAPQTPPAAPQPQGAVMAAPGSREDALEIWRGVASAAKRCVAQAEKIYADLNFEIERKVEPHEIQALAATMMIQLSRSTDLTLLLKQEAAAPAPAPPPQPQPPAAPPPPQEAPANPADDDLPF